ncbi:hypothetical protein [Streptomyces sioyaensis]|uniref:hypothetical protein n=1 Tax=Streptomyces sioyaensis TaxID=67364 RepID=UPI003D725B50
MEDALRVAARADEVLCLNVEDLYPQDKRGRITAKGGATEWIHWQSGTAQLLPRLIARRTRGSLFLTDRKAPAGTPTLDVCPETGRARLKIRAVQCFKIIPLPPSARISVTPHQDADCLVPGAEVCDRRAVGG